MTESLGWQNGILLALGLLLVFVAYKKLNKKAYQLELKTLLPLIAFILLAYFSSRYLILEAKLPGLADGELALIPVLSLSFPILALGYLGLLPGLLVSLAASLALVIHHGQPLSLILIYTAALFLVAEKYASPEERGKRSGLLRKFLTAYLQLIPAILLLQFLYFLLHGRGDLMAMTRSAFTIWISLLPAILLSILLVHAANIFTSLSWSPSPFIRATGSRKLVIDYATKQIETLAAGNLDLPSSVQPNSIQEEVLFAKILDLRNALTKRQDLVNEALALHSDYLTPEGLGQSLSGLLKSALAYQADSARLIVVGADAKEASLQVREKFGEGELAETYAPMDLILLNRIADNEKLMLTDLKAKQYFGLNEDLKTPKALMAFSQKLSDDEKMLFWLGFQDNKLFNSRESKYYEALSLRLREILQTQRELDQAHDQGAWLISAIDSLSKATLILNLRNKLIFANQEGNKLLERYPALLSSGASASEDLRQILNQDGLESVSFSFILGTDQFHASYFPITDGKMPLGKVIQIEDAANVSETDRQKVEFLTNISHDLQAPLKLIKGYLLLLQNLGEAPAEHAKYLEKIHANVETMDILTHKLLSLEQLSSRHTLSYETVDLRKLIEEVVSVLALQANQKRIEILRDFSGLRNDYIMADPVLLQEAIFNLLENAIKYSPSKSQVGVKAYKDADAAYLLFVDKGKGISLMDREKVFDRYYRVDEGQSFSMRGQGLGLSIARDVAEKHNGRIEVQSKLGEGSTFTLILPLRTEN